MTTTTELVLNIVRDINPGIAIDSSQTGVALFDLGLDSLDHASILLQVEEEFEIKIPDEESEGLLTVEAIVKSINEKLA